MANTQGLFIDEDADLLPPSDDRIFKTMLIHPDAKQVLIDIISTVIEQKVVDVQIRNNELPTMDLEEKNERFDVNCTIETEKGFKDQVNVEMSSTERVEIKKDRGNFINKYTYYASDYHSSQKSVGVTYKNLVRTYQITFSMHTVFPNRHDFASWFSLRTQDGEQFSDQINLIIVELSKLNEALTKPVDQLTSFEKWSLFLKFAPDPVHRNLINDIITEKEEIGMAATLLREISQDERERAILRSRRMAETDRISDLLTSEEKGKIKGEQLANERWQVIVADNHAKLADKDAEIVNKNTEIELLRLQIADLQAKNREGSVR